MHLAPAAVFGVCLPLPGVVAAIRAQFVALERDTRQDRAGVVVFVAAVILLLLDQ